MFTGLIEALGKVVSASADRLEIAAGFEEVCEGDSVCVSGACLTVVRVGPDRLTFDLSEETVRKRENYLKMNGKKVFSVAVHKFQ